MKNKTKVIVFDLGNVLIPFDYSRLQKRMNKIDSGLGDRFLKKYYDNYDVHRGYERWQINNKEFIKILIEWSENKIPEEDLKSIYADLFIENKDVISLLPILKQKYKLVLLSNTNFIHQQYGWAKYDFLKYFDKLVLSHEVGAIKPEEKIYKAVETFTEELSERHLFIDDIAEYIDGAKNLGWSGIQFRNYNQLLYELKILGILK